MFRVNIKRNNELTHSGLRETQAQVDAWIAECESVQAWGKPAWTETILATDDTPEHYIQHPAEYTIEVTDITSQVEQEKINAEALAYLASTDWMIVRAMENADKPVPEEIKLLRQQARDRIVK